MTSKLSLGLPLAAFGALSVQAANLDLTIEGVRSNDGEILIGIYYREDAFKSALDSLSAALAKDAEDI